MNEHLLELNNLNKTHEHTHTHILPLKIHRSGDAYLNTSENASVKHTHCKEENFIFINERKRRMKKSAFGRDNKDIATLYEGNKMNKVNSVLSLA